MIDYGSARPADDTPQELSKRFNLLDFESRNVVDFYFVGWMPSDTGIAFDLPSFEEFRTVLRRHGVRHFGGNADLLLADARLADGVASIDFSRAIRVDLARAVADGHFATLGGFLQSVIDAAERVKGHSKGTTSSAVFSISDRLGLAIAGRSILDFIYEKWGKIIGAKQLDAVAVRKLGP